MTNLDGQNSPHDSMALPDEGQPGTNAEFDVDTYVCSLSSSHSDKIENKSIDYPTSQSELSFSSC